MWEKVLEVARNILTLNGRVDKHDETISSLQREIKELRDEMKLMAEAIRFMHDEQQRERERSTHAQENLVLRIENALLKAGIGTLSTGNMPAIPPPDEE